VVSNCTSSKFNVGICFPSKAKQLGSTERSYPLIIPLPTHANDTLESKDNTRAVLIRQVPTRMTGQPKTGYLLWGAARVLARWIHLNQDKFKYRTVLEVGSGLGLGGIVAAHYAKQITLTDYQADTLRALEYNLKLNGFDVSSNGSSDESQPVTSNVIVDFLDWDHLEDIEEHKKADIVIGCDIICEPSTAIGFLAVIRRHLKQNGVAYLLNANSHSRFGVIHLHDLLSKANDLCSTITPVHEMVQGNKLLETVHDAKELSYEYYEIRHFYQQ
jgi:predicted nicotinamide N-methyase